MKPASADRRFRAMKAVVCAVLLVCVLIVVIAPQVDLPPALRGHRLIAAVLIQLIALALAAVRIQPGHASVALISLREAPSPPPLSRLSIFCVLLC